MSIIANNLLQGDEGYNISRSLRFRSSASAYLNRTFSAPTNQKIWTWSSWVKRGSTISSGSDTLFSSSDNYNTIRFQSTDEIIVYGDAGGTMEVTTTAKYRDPSAWYHFVVAFDSTQATSSNRVKIYVNGVQVTSFSASTYPSLNATYGFNSAIAHAIGRRQSTSNLYFDGYMAETNFIDGQSLTPSSFGETDPITGVWKAKKYGGTYGANGFYLPFSDNTSTTTLGYDKSGNSNNWTTNNISLTAGTTYDSMVDVPTMSALASNYCVLSPIDKYDNPPTEGNLRRTGVGHGGSPWSSCRGTLGVSSGKWYFEATLTGSTGSTGNNMVGIMTTATSTLSDAYGGAVSRSYQANGGMQGDNSTGTVSSASSGDVIMCAFDIDAGKVWFGKNGTWFNSGVPASGTGNVFTSVPTTPVVPALHMYGNTGDNYGWFTNFGQRPFSYTPPTGFVALNTFNLPEPSIKAGNKYMDAITYTGNGGTLNITGLGFQPDLAWIKCRSAASSNNNYDSVRGVTKALFSNTTDAETTLSGGLTAFNSDGYTLGSEGISNTSGRTYVAWNWKAGNSAGSSNTAGSITSTVSANPTAGFSVVTYTSTTGTVGHGLGVAPAMIIMKGRNVSDQWTVGHKDLNGGSSPWNYGLPLNTVAGIQTNSGFWNNTAPTSSVFSQGSWDSGYTKVAYCFTPIAGYSAFGSYDGNSSSDGVFVYVGFKPRWIMIRERTSVGGDWFIYDSSRNTYNVVTNYLIAEGSDAESSDSAYVLDFVSNGFKFRGAGGGINYSGRSYIYACFAENPFKYSLAR